MYNKSYLFILNILYLFKFTLQIPKCFVKVGKGLKEFCTLSQHIKITFKLSYMKKIHMNGHDISSLE